MVSSSSSTTPPAGRDKLLDFEEYIDIEDDEDMEYENTSNEDFIVVSKPTKFAVAATIPKEPKKPSKDIIKLVNEAFIDKEGFKGAIIRRVHLIRTVVVYFDNNTDKIDATNKILKQDDYSLPKLEDYDDYKNSMQFDARTIKITDLHLNLKMDDIKTLFAKYGNITNCVVQTPKDSLWQNAYVTYESPNAITNFFHAWGRLVFNDYVKIGRAHV